MNFVSSVLGLIGALLSSVFGLLLSPFHPSYSPPTYIMSWGTPSGPAAGSYPQAVTPTATASVPVLGIFIWTSSEASYWNSVAKPTDYAFALPTAWTALPNVSVGNRVLIQTNPSTGSINTLVTQSQSDGYSIAGLNDETTPNCATLVSDMSNANTIITAAPLTFLYAPTGNAVENCIPTNASMVTTPTILIYQTQAHQVNLGTMGGIVNKNIKSLRVQNPSILIFCQVSTNPPANPNVTAGELASAINLLAGLENPPDGIVIFYGNPTQDPTREQVMEQVVNLYR